MKNQWILVQIDKPYPLLHQHRHTLDLGANTPERQPPDQRKHIFNKKKLEIKIR